MKKLSIVSKCTGALLAVNLCVIVLFFTVPNNMPSIIRGTGDFSDERYSRQLFMLRESSLMDSDSHIYRFTNINDVFPYTIRIEIMPDGSGYLNFRMNTRMWEIGRSLLFRSSQKRLNEEQVNELLGILDGHNFWNIPENSEVMGLGGETWIMEGVKDGRYHIVHRWSPDFYEEGKVVYNIGNYFLELSGEPAFSYCLAAMRLLLWVYLVFGTPIILFGFAFSLAKRLKSIS